MDLYYSPFDFDIQEDPYPVYARLRAEAPLYRNERDDFWALSRHADILAALRDSTRFSSVNGLRIEPAFWGPDAEKFFSFVAMDPPKHTRMRGLVSRAFTQRRVQALEPAAAAQVLHGQRAVAGRLHPEPVVLDPVTVPGGGRLGVRRRHRARGKAVEVHEQRVGSVDAQHV